MTAASDWTCHCRAVNSSAAVWCEACGVERPDRAGRPRRVVPHVPETQRLVSAPTYREPTPAEDAEIRAELATLKAQAWWRETRGTGRLPAVDPLVRAEVARRAGQPEPVGAVLPRVLPGRA